MKHTPHIYLPGPWDADVVEATSQQVRHLAKVLKVGAGSDVTYTDGKGTFGSGVWTGDHIERGDESQRARPSNLAMAVAPPANKERARFVVEKLAELGVSSLFWLATEWGNRRAPVIDKTLAWSISALEQSRGAWLMEIDAALKGWSSLERPLAVCVPGGGDIDFQPRTLAIGPEGGLSPDEVPEGAGLVSLGETILRVETAAVVAASRFILNGSAKSI